MNKNNRKDLEKAIQLLQEAQSIIENIASEEREKYDNLTEGLQQTERGMKYEETADELESVVSDIENSIDSINDIL